MLAYTKVYVCYRGPNQFELCFLKKDKRKKVLEEKGGFYFPKRDVV